MTVSKQGDFVNFDFDTFFGLVKELEIRPKSDIMFSKLYEECNAILCYSGYPEGLLSINSSASIKTDDSSHEIDLYRDTTFILNDSIMTLYFKGEGKEGWWNMHMASFGQGFLPAKLECFDEKLKFVSEYYYT